MRHLATVGFLLAAVGLILSFGRYGNSALVPEARRLMLLGGLAILPAGVWHARYRSVYVEGSGLPHGYSAAFFTSVALALLGAGMEYDHPDDPWLVLLLPGALTMSYFAYWLAFSPKARTFPRRWLGCTGAIMFAIAGFWIAGVSLT